MISANLPPNFANAISPFDSLGKLPVGEESRETRNTPFKAVEELAQTARTENRRAADERPGEVEQREQLRDPLQQVQGNSDQNSDKTAEGKQLHQQKQQEIARLSERDREVRNHEQAHAAAGGQFAGAPRFTFQRGPDGVNYAVAGEVSIDTSTIANDPQAAIEKAQTIRRAALAPGDPSPQDRLIAARATQIEIQAHAELAQVRREEAQLEQLQHAEENQQRERAREEEEKRREDIQSDEDNNLTAADRFAEINDLNLDLNRRLIDIGVTPDINPSGGLLDQTV